jgi:hypothetical protein
MLNRLREKYREQGRQEELARMIEKFEELHTDYYGQGDMTAADLIVELVAWLQDDWEALGG